MENQEKQQIEAALRQWSQTTAVPTDTIEFRIVRDLGGSGFARIYRIDTNLGQFVAKFSLEMKTGHATEGTSEAMRQLNPLEAEGLCLQQLSQQSQIRVPKVICQPTPDIGLLLTEFIPKRQLPLHFEEDFGRRLATMHNELQGERFGWQADNYLGATVQQNAWNDDWPQFWFSQRMLPQIALARQQRLCDDHALGQLNLLAEGMLVFLQKQEHPCSLIHGDLWSGNFWCDGNGRPVIIDPACYYANPVAELGMISLFGSLGQGFLTAYFEVIPPPQDRETTIAIYRFYHLLNHLNLFGNNYLTQVQWEASDLLKRL